MGIKGYGMWQEFVDTLPEHECHAAPRAGCIGNCRQGRDVCRTPATCSNGDLTAASGIVVWSSAGLIIVLCAALVVWSLL